MLRVTFLGTSAARPTVGRNVSSIAVQREGEVMLFDCGEGTQRQMMRYATGFAINDIFFSHLHADHFLGVIGLLRTMSLQGRTEPMRLWAPEGGAAILHAAVNLGVERVAFPIEVVELASHQSIARDGYDIVPYRNQHGSGSLGYALIEHDRLGRFHPDRAKELGVPEGPLFGKLHRGEPVTVDGRTILPDEVVGERRPGRRLVYSGDTRPCNATLEIAARADVLIHDCTFGHDEIDRAKATGHATAGEAGMLARKARVRRLVLTHISARYAEDPRLLEREARRFFSDAVVAHDGLEIDIPFADTEQPT